MRGEGAEIILVDAGDFLGGPDELAGIKARFVVGLMGSLGQDALNLGERDLARGLGFARRVADSCGVPLLSANVREKNTGRSLLRPHVVRQVGVRRTGPFRHGGYRVGILGVLGKDATRAPLPADSVSLDLADPLQAARQAVQELRSEKKCRMVIALSHLGLSGSRELAREVPGLDLIVVGHAGGHLARPERVGDAFIVSAGDQGSELGDISYNLGPDGSPILEEARTVTLGQDVPEDPQAVRVMTAYQEAFQRFLADPQEFPADLRAAEKIYIGVDGCAACHADIVTSWRATAHARAFAGLARTGDDVKPDCVRCHVTGYLAGNGFRHRKWTPNLTDVQCEACHGPAARHVASVGAAPAGAAAAATQTGSRLPRKGLTTHGLMEITPMMCTGCHHGTNDPDFNFERDVQKIRHHPSP